MHAVSHPGPNKIRVIGLRVVVLAVASSMLLIVRVTPETPHVDIPGVPAQSLEQLGVKFLPPNGTPVVSADEARLSAISQVPTLDSPILDTVLVQMVDPQSGIDQLVWVNRIDTTRQPFFVPPGNYIPPNLLPTGPYIHNVAQSEQAPTPDPLPPQSYYLIFVDANTGEVLYAIYG